MCIYIYTYVYTCVDIYTYVYICIHSKKNKEATSYHVRETRQYFIVMCEVSAIDKVQSLVAIQVTVC